jgi:hypothetical protein
MSFPFPHDPIHLPKREEVRAKLDFISLCALECVFVFDRAVEAEMDWQEGRERGGSGVRWMKRQTKTVK